MAGTPIWQNLAIFVLGSPYSEARKGPGPDLPNFGCFCIKHRQSGPL